MPTEPARLVLIVKTTNAQQLEYNVQDGQPSHPYRAHKTLHSTLHALFRKQLSEQELTALLDALCKVGGEDRRHQGDAYDLPSKVERT